mgnify:CR=1 FL=1
MFLRVSSPKNAPAEALSDQELIASYRETDESEQVGVLFERYTHWIYGVCLKYLKDEELAKDAVLQIFEKLLTELKKHEIQNFRPWLHQVARNHCLMHLRKKNPVSASLSDMEWEPEEHPDTERETKEQTEVQLNQLEEGIAQLNPEQRQCIELFFLKEKSYKEIEAQTGFTNKQVKSHIQNGRRNLKKWMGVLPMLIALFDFIVP